MLKVHSVFKSYMSFKVLLWEKTAAAELLSAAAFCLLEQHQSWSVACEKTVKATSTEFISYTEITNYSQVGQQNFGSWVFLLKFTFSALHSFSKSALINITVHGQHRDFRCHRDFTRHSWWNDRCHEIFWPPQGVTTCKWTGVTIPEDYLQTSKM